MVKTMKKYNVSVMVLVALILLLTLVSSIQAQTFNETQTFFSSDYAGLSIKVDAMRETVPDANLTVKLWVNCTALGVRVECLNISVYGFKEGKEKILLNSTCLLKDTSLPLNYANEYDFLVNLPSDVWGATLADLYLKYFIYSDLYTRNPFFSLTIVRNVYYEKLQEDFNRLNESYHQLSEEFEQLNQTYLKLQENYTTLNQTYWKVQSSLKELDDTRQVAVILGITTVFFVATTFYLVMRKPKQYW